MNVRGIEISQSIANEIVAKAKTLWLFGAYLEEMERQCEFLEHDKSVQMEVKYQKESFPECKVVFQFHFDADGPFEIGASGCPDKNDVIEIYVAYNYNSSLRKIQSRFLSHIEKTYEMKILEYHPTLHLEGHIIEIKCRGNGVIEDIKEGFPEVNILKVGDILRIWME